MKKDSKRERRSLRSWTDLSDFKNIHMGAKCFVVGAGPSVAFLDLKGIHEHPVIAVNSAAIMMPWKKQGDISKRFWISNDSLCLKWSYFWDNVAEAHCNKIVRTSWKKHENKIEKYGMRYFEPRESELAPNFGDDRGLCSISSVPTAIDFAILMGCKSVYLLGVDHNMMHGNSHFWQFWDYAKWPKRDDKGKRFRPEQGHQTKMFEFNKVVFKCLEKFAQSRNVCIYNCSMRSGLDVFEKISLDNALEKS